MELLRFMHRILPSMTLQQPFHTPRLPTDAASASMAVCWKTCAKAMTKALKDAGIAPTAVDYYNAHGTSTHLNDLTETQMLKIALGEHAYKIKVSSTKSMTGHCVGAAGVIEAMISTLAICDSFYPATINLDNPDIECDLDYVPHKGVEGNIDVAVSASLGFGGHNGIVVIKKFKD